MRCCGRTRARASSSPRPTPSSSACRTGRAWRRARCPPRRPATSCRWTTSSRWLEANGFDRTRDGARHGRIRRARRHRRPLGAGQRRIRSGSISSATRWRRSAPSTRRPSARTGQTPRLDLVPASEVILTEETIERFRQNYRAAFGAVLGGDPLYEAVSEGPALRRHGALAALLLRAAGDAVRLPAGSAGRHRPSGGGDDRRPPRAGARPLRGAAGGGSRGGRQADRLRALQAGPARGALSHARRVALAAGRPPARASDALRPAGRRPARRSTWAGAPAAPLPPSAPPAT